MSENASLILEGVSKRFGSFVARGQHEHEYSKGLHLRLSGPQRCRKDNHDPHDHEYHLS